MDETSQNVPHDDADAQPTQGRRWVSRDEVSRLLATPTDAAVLDEVAAHDPDDGLPRGR